MRNSCLYKNKPKTFRRASSQLFKLWGANLQNIEKSIRAMYFSDGVPIGSNLPKESLDLLNKLKYWLKTGDLTIFTEEELVNIRVMLQADQSGAEALIVAYDSEAGDFRKLFIHGVKPHVYVAMKLFQEKWKAKIVEHKLSITEYDIDILCLTPIEKLKLNPAFRELDALIRSSDNWSQEERYYFLAKKMVHAYDNGMNSPASLQMYILEGSEGKVTISKDNATLFLTLHASLFPELAERAERYKQIVDTTKIIYNLFGFPFFVTTENPTAKTYRDCQTWPQQSTVGEITRIALTQLQEYIEEQKKPWDILNDCHDSYLTQCPLIDAKECASMKQKLMQQKLKSLVDGTEFYMKSECQIGFNWGPFKEGKNDLGLREVKWLTEL